MIRTHPVVHRILQKQTELEKALCQIKTTQEQILKILQQKCPSSRGPAIQSLVQDDATPTAEYPAHELNNIIQSNIQSKAGTCKSVDTVEEADETVNYPTEFFNSLDLPGIPSHVRLLEIGVPIIMLRNIIQPKLCDATRLVVKKLISDAVEATIFTEPFKDNTDPTNAFILEHFIR
ncbi:uncharacterized protein [Procambarus clarkii]|uniref:uncharacterized protein n=1 Tax=Procambarus clarkii TaxID=6728 RepID=UPI003744A9D0